MVREHIMRHQHSAFANVFYMSGLEDLIAYPSMLIRQGCLQEINCKIMQKF